METHVNVVRGACLRHAGRGSGAGQEGGGGDCDGDVQDHGLTAAQFQAACADLANEKDFGEFKKLADNEGLSSAVYSRYCCMCVCLCVVCDHQRTSLFAHHASFSPACTTYNVESMMSKTLKIAPQEQTKKLRLLGFAAREDTRH